MKNSFLATLDMASGVLRSAWGDPHAWDSSIRRFVAADRLSPPAPGGIVFTGSSSITFWDSLAEDLAPLPVLNRGFGGSKIADAAAYAGRTVLPYRPRAVVLYAGTNDLAWPRPATPARVRAGFAAFVAVVHQTQPDLAIYFVSICPTPSRARYEGLVREANRLIQADCAAEPRLHYVDLVPALLGPDGRPDPALFRPDRLHPSPAGYARWTAVLRSVLLAEFPE